MHKTIIQLALKSKKIRPAVVISSDAAGKLPIELVAPITDWKPYFAKNFWHVQKEFTILHFEPILPNSKAQLVRA